jgi:hypothetical protein
VAHHDMTLERRLRAARPHAAAVDETTFDQELLDRVRDLPIDRRRHVPRGVVVPVAAGATTLAVAGVLMLAGGPGGGPSAAAAITQTLHWLTPPAGTVLHVRSAATQDGRTTTREYWQSADRPTQAREVLGGAQRYELSGDAVYDPATDTIYDPPASKEPSKVPAGKDDPRTSVPPSDPIVAKVRILLQNGDMEVTGPEVHNGTEAWAISLKQGVGRPVWTLWVSAANGKPLELRDPGRDASEAPQVIRWSAYEVLPAREAAGLTTLRGAHPSARVVDDPDEVAAAEQRLGAAKRR